MNNKRLITGGAGAIFLMMAFSVFKVLQEKPRSNSADDALLSIIKNDKDAFRAFIEGKGDVHGPLPVIDGKVLSVAEGIAYYERKEFIEILQQAKSKFIRHDRSKDYDILSLTVGKNNPELFKLLLRENPELRHTYGKSGWSLLHMASAVCSHKLISLLHANGKLSWDLRAKDGTTPLTLAADHDCLPALSYWKEQAADFRALDGRGMSALQILKQKKDAALTAFAMSFEPPRQPASITVAAAVLPKAAPVSFYKKRKFPKEKAIDYSSMIEPGDRPDDANETADFTEFSD